MRPFHFRPRLSIAFPRTNMPMDFMISARFAAFVALGLAITSSASTAEEAPRPVTRDRFLDRSERRGPELVHVPARAFVMGSAPTDPGYRAEESRHRVELSAYSIARFETTNADYCEFLNEEGNRVELGIRWILTDRTDTCLIREEAGFFEPVEGAERRPVVAVSWAGANAYCRWLSARTGRTYRLPTEAEWECAARAGTATAWYWGDAWRGDMVQWRESPSRSTAPVGSHPANPWGLHDVYGNVWEWVSDCTRDDFYAVSPARDPVLYEAQCWTPGIRGGSWDDGPEYCRSGHRVNTWWWGEYAGVGFRVAREESPNAWYRARRTGKRATTPVQEKTRERAPQ